MRMSTCVSEENLIVTTQEVKDDSEMAPGDVVATSSKSVSTEALTLGDLMSMEDSQSSLNNSNTHGPEEDRETEHEITEESMEDSQRSLNNSNTHGPEENIERETEEPIVESLRFLLSKNVESESQGLENVIEEPCHHDLFSRRPARMTNSRPTSARMIDSEPTSVSGFRSARSEGSSVSASSFGFPILQSERNISTVRKRTKRGKEKGWRRYSLRLCCRF
ncbi:PREDICTED: uncharacterized protein LOC104755653 [Camelina sativa]|uniref:Uncharacterized protein LOC104755653 n=1 Tax=Camelina sativa TaxID=90675 RepID=A0ABM0WUJ9_CAMSA|nr:PREDICTED: uncharacterized protein LOC104755653 [Camelina sativa]XP_019095021.1 PREDICTED: uncharacterized protein LOC104755653 [Camelina sativa]